MKYCSQMSQSQQNEELERHTRACGAACVHTHAGSTATARTTHVFKYTFTWLQARAVHLDVINQCDWIASARLCLELRRKGLFWGWTDPNRLWQGNYWKQVRGLRSAGEAPPSTAAPGSSARDPVCSDTAYIADM